MLWVLEGTWKANEAPLLIWKEENGRLWFNSRSGGDTNFVFGPYPLLLEVSAGEK